MDSAPRSFTGIAAASGLATGPAWVFERPLLTIVEREITNPLQEVELLQAAVESTVAELDELDARVRNALGDTAAQIIRAQKVIAQDESLLTQIVDHIRGGHLCAEGAVRRVFDRYHALFEAMDEDSYIRTRITDVEDVAQRIVRNLLGLPDVTLASVDEPSVVVADDLFPSDTALLDTSRVLAIATERGGATSHVAILAGTIGIPAAMSVRGLLAAVRTGDEIVIDSDSVSGAHVYLRPDHATRQVIAGRKRRRAAHDGLVSAFHGRPASTSDGHAVTTSANIGSIEDIEPARAAGATSVGLFRSEMLYLNGPPDEESQYEAYRAAAEAFRDGFVVIRTLDVGGDKHVPGIPLPQEANPFLGSRGLRVLLQRPRLFQAHLRAILRASRHGPVRIMFPMVAGIRELDEALAHLATCRRELVSHGEALPPVIETGIMVEVPSNILIADELAQRVNFFSIGTNDLTQYLLAADRLNGDVAEYYRAYDPSVFRAIRVIVEAARRHGRAVGVCGELSGDVLAIPVLVGLGVEELSMSPTRLVEASWILAQYTHDETKFLADRVLALDTHERILALLREQLAAKEQQMSAKKRILVACGTAIATSTVVARKLEEELGRRGIDVETTQCKAVEVPSQVAGHDLVVATTFVSGTGEVPVIQSVSFLTGVGVDEDIERIVAILTRN